MYTNKARLEKRCREANVKAVWFLLCRDRDRARHDNGIGFNSPDSERFHSIYDSYDAYEEALKVRDVLIELDSHRLQKYRSQLEEAGIHPEDLELRWEAV